MGSQVREVRLENLVKICPTLQVTRELENKQLFLTLSDWQNQSVILSLQLARDTGRKAFSHLLLDVGRNPTALPRAVWCPYFGYTHLGSGFHFIHKNIGMKGQEESLESSVQSTCSSVSDGSCQILTCNRAAGSRIKSGREQPHTLRNAGQTVDVGTPMGVCVCEEMHLNFLT